VPDAAGFEAFYGEHFARIVRACTLVTLDHALAEDIAAESFARLWSRWGTIHGEDHAGGYVFKTAMRLSSKELRKRSRHAGKAVDSPTATDEIQQALDREDAIRALRELPLRQRQVVVLRDWAGFETRDVARMLGARESTVRVHLARAREQLRAKLSVEDREQ
jgi:RNA polymerase sigma factor (sigma-70 family)